MKAEINNENKARFFALYWGQNVIRGNCGQELHVCPSVNLSHKGWWLELKPLFQISDEEIFDITGIYNRTMFFNQCLFMGAVEADILRSRGYAIPWMGLSVDELFKAGWIKLREPKP